MIEKVQARWRKLPFLYSVLAIYVVGLLLLIGHLGLLTAREREQMNLALVHAQAEAVAERVAGVVGRAPLSADEGAAEELFQQLRSERPELQAFEVRWPDGTVVARGTSKDAIRVRRDFEATPVGGPVSVEVAVAVREHRTFSAVDAWLGLTFVVATLLGAGAFLHVSRRFRQLHRVMDGLEAQRSTVAAIAGTDEFAQLGRRLVRVFHPWSQPRRRAGTTIPRFFAANDTGFTRPSPAPPTRPAVEESASVSKSRERSLLHLQVRGKNRRLG